VFTDINDDRLLWLENDFLNYFADWQQAVENRAGNFTARQKQQMQLSVQTLNGFKITSQSVAEITRIVLASGAQFVMTNHMNQDALEQLFGHTRHKSGSNNNPTAEEASNSINTIRVVSTQAISSSHGNTKPSSKQLDFAPLPKRRKH
jgi:hypothetical protein